MALESFVVAAAFLLIVTSVTVALSIRLGLGSVIGLEVQPSRLAAMRREVCGNWTTPEALTNPCLDRKLPLVMGENATGPAARQNVAFGSRKSVLTSREGRR
jgi:hypothetical protein